LNVRLARSGIRTATSTHAPRGCCENVRCASLARRAFEVRQPPDRRELWQGESPEYGLVDRDELANWIVRLRG